jgi:hypothetical protein
MKFKKGKESWAGYLKCSEGQGGQCLWEYAKDLVPYSKSSGHLKSFEHVSCMLKFIFYQTFLAPYVTIF